MIKIMGKKLSMSYLYNQQGEYIPVTLVYIYKHFLFDIVDNLDIIKFKLSTIQINNKKTNKALEGFYLKKNIPVCKYMWENSIKEKDLIYNIDVIDINFLKPELVNVIGISKGKGFAGVIKRWGFHMQDATHGNSLSHRAPGSIGQNQTPGRVIKGKKMAGQLGNKQITIKNLMILKIDYSKQIIYLNGSIPGSNNKFVFIQLQH